MSTTPNTPTGTTISDVLGRLLVQESMSNPAVLDEVMEMHAEMKDDPNAVRMTGNEILDAFAACLARRSAITTFEDSTTIFTPASSVVSASGPVAGVFQSANEVTKCKGKENAKEGEKKNGKEAGKENGIQYDKGKSKGKGKEKMDTPLTTMLDFLGSKKLLGSMKALDTTKVLDITATPNIIGETSDLPKSVDIGKPEMTKSNNETAVQTMSLSERATIILCGLNFKADLKKAATWHIIVDLMLMSSSEVSPRARFVATLFVFAVMKCITLSELQASMKKSKADIPSLQQSGLIVFCWIIAASFCAVKLTTVSEMEVQAV